LSSIAYSGPSLSVRTESVTSKDQVIARLSRAQPNHSVRVFLVTSQALQNVDSMQDPLLRTVGSIRTNRRGDGSLAFTMPVVPPDVFSLIACCSARRFVRGTGLLAVRAESPPGFGPLGSSGCAPASPRNTGATSGLGENEVFGTGVGGELWTLFILPSDSAWASSTSAVIDGVVNKQVKIIFKFDDGAGSLYAVDPSGVQVKPVWGPESHGSSNWLRPGAEWGAGFVFDRPGCWRIHVSSGRSFGDAWLAVQS
jgi:hypothetical protein